MLLKILWNIYLFVFVVFYVHCNVSLVFYDLFNLALKLHYFSWFKCILGNTFVLVQLFISREKCWNIKSLCIPMCMSWQ